MISVDNNNKVSIHKQFAEQLSARKAQEAKDSAALVNRLLADLVANKGEFPKPGTAPSKAPTAAAQKLAKQGVEALTRKSPAPNPAEAIKLFTQALETVLARPYYESMQLTMGEVCQCLGPRCDAYLAARQFPKAYADACMLSLLNPQDPQAYFRKGMCLMEGGIKDQSIIALEYATTLAPQNQMFAAVLARARDLPDTQ